MKKALLVCGLALLFGCSHSNKITNPNSNQAKTDHDSSQVITFRGHFHYANECRFVSTADFELPERIELRLQGENPHDSLNIAEGAPVLITGTRTNAHSFCDLDEVVFVHRHGIRLWYQIDLPHCEF